MRGVAHGAFMSVRPIVLWPHPPTRDRRRATFSASWSATADLLHREVMQLGATSVVLQLAVSEDDIRLDGAIRANAKPSHPGVIVSFRARYGDLEYSTDVFTHWQDNVRAIAFGLESLRRVDRYGIAKRGEQYTGWLQLPAGGGDGAGDRSAARGRKLIRLHGCVAAALKATHPDHGGDVDDFAAVQAAREAGAA